MATWITHLMIADRVLESIPELNRHGFCVGNIAPDCNIENEDWTQFVPPRKSRPYFTLRCDKVGLLFCLYNFRNFYLLFDYIMLKYT